MLLRKLKYLLTLLFLLCLAFDGTSQFYFGSHQTFGKNRLQHKDFEWQYYQFRRYTTHFYTGGKELAAYVGEHAIVHLEQVEDIFDYGVEDKIEFVIYNTHSDFLQSNVGHNINENFNIGGVTNVIDNKVFIYFEGDHKQLDAQIRSGVAQVLINQMMYGGSWTQAIRSSTLLTIPDWYVNGLSSYVGNEWDTDIDNMVRDGIMSGEYREFNRLMGEDAIYAGHAIWNYIAQVYGKGVIPNILYMTKISRNIESGFLYVLGTSLSSLSNDFYRFYQKKYQYDDAGRIDMNADRIPVRQKSSRSYDQFSLSPKGQYAAYVSHEFGQSRLYIADVASYDAENDRYAQSYQISKDGVKLLRINDHSNPVLSWHPKLDVLAYVTEEKGELLLNIFSLYDNNDKEKPLYKGFDPFGGKKRKAKNTIKLLQLDKVLSMNYAPDGKHIVFSGVKDGRTNIYHYRVMGNRHEKITDDQYDDLDPDFNIDGTKIVFSSNRPDDTLRTHYDYKPRANHNLFVYDLDRKKLSQFTKTKGVNEMQSNPYDSTQYTYLSDKSGIHNRYVSYLDSTISHIDTVVHYRFMTKTFPVSNLSRNILHYNTQPQIGKYSALIKEDGQYNFYVGKIKDDRIYSFADIYPTSFYSDQKHIREESRRESQSKIIEKSTQGDTLNLNEIDINFYIFEDEKEEIRKKRDERLKEDAEKVTEAQEEKEQKKEEDEKAKSEEEKEPFKVPTQRNYNINFTQTELITQLDNNYLSETYQPFTGLASGFQMPGINGLIMYGLKDLFEDYHVLGGFRLSPTLSDFEYYLSLDDLSKRTDKKYSFYRQSLELQQGIQVTRMIINEARVRWSYPFSEVASIRYSLIGRYDQRIIRATSSDLAPEPDRRSFMLGSKLEYVYDNTLGLGLNLYRGTRLKLFGEYFQPLVPDSDVFIVGADIRNYIQIHKEFIWANRFAASSSFGSQRLIYYMGGVDNWVRNRFDHDNEIPDNQTFAFQTIATPVRGHIQNARNGNNFAVLNSELRFPIFKYFSDRPSKSDFLNNFQIIGFGDVGAAWTGLHPYSDENPFNTEVIEQPVGVDIPTLTITIERQREPIIGGFGIGLRSRIWGYFIRFDYAWGVNDGVVMDPMPYLSLSLDF